MTIKVDKKIPLPKRWDYRKKYPWDEMEVGDSFLFPEFDNKTTPYALVRGHNVRMQAKGREERFEVHKTDEGLRCWRVS